jgi:MFS family permease
MPIKLRRSGAFWFVAITLALMLFASSAPSPLYVVYQAHWHFSAITLTCVFAVYVLALLVSLLFAGSLSDHVGRRPTLAIALVVELLAMALFEAAQSVALLFAARTVQGLATGLAMGALSAALIDLAPPSRPQLGALISSAAPLLGLAAGALGSGLLVDHGPDPLRLIYLVLIGLFIVVAPGVLVMPETVTSPTRGGWHRHLRLRVAVPHEARGAFASASPLMMATWALGGLYLSLGPSLAISMLHSSSHVAGALVIVALCLTGAMASLVLQRYPSERVMTVGAVLLTAGVALTLVALNATSSALFYAGSVLAGAGFGPGFLGAFRAVVAHAPAGERAALIAAIYVVSYLAFSLPAIAAGVAVTESSLLATTNVYGGAVIALSLGALALTAARRRTTLVMSA